VPSGVTRRAITRTAWEILADLLAIHYALSMKIAMSFVLMESQAFRSWAAYGFWALKSRVPEVEAWCPVVFPDACTTVMLGKGLLVGWRRWESSLIWQSWGSSMI